MSSFWISISRSSRAASSSAASSSSRAFRRVGLAVVGWDQNLDGVSHSPWREGKSALRLDLGTDSISNILVTAPLVGVLFSFPSNITPHSVLSSNHFCQQQQQLELLELPVHAQCGSSWVTSAYEGAKVKISPWANPEKSLRKGSLVPRAGTKVSLHKCED